MTAAPESAHDAAWWAYQAAWRDGSRADGDIGQHALREAVDAAAPAIRVQERELLAQSDAVRSARDILASDDLMTLVRAEPACSRDEAMSAAGGLIGTLRLVLQTIGGER